MRVSSIHNGVARLQNEPRGVRRVMETFDLRDRRVHYQRVFVLKRDAVLASSRVAVDDERKSRHVGRLRLGRETANFRIRQAGVFPLPA